MPKTYLLRDLDETLWRHFKSAASLKGLSIKEALDVAVKMFIVEAKQVSIAEAEAYAFECDASLAQTAEAQRIKAAATGAKVDG